MCVVGSPDHVAVCDTVGLSPTAPRTLVLGVSAGAGAEVFRYKLKRWGQPNRNASTSDQPRAWYSVLGARSAGSVGTAHVRQG